MSKEQFEEELRRKIKGYQPEVDTQLLWNNIKQQQPKSYLGWVSMFMVAMSLGIGFAFWNISESEQTLHSENQNKTIESENIYTLDQNTSSNTISNNNESGFETNSNHSEEATFNNKIETSNNQTQIAYNSNNNNAKENTNIAEASYNQSKKKQSTTEAKVFETNVNKVAEINDVANYNNIENENVSDISGVVAIQEAVKSEHVEANVNDVAINTNENSDVFENEVESNSEFENTFNNVVVGNTENDNTIPVEVESTTNSNQLNESVEIAQQEFAQAEYSDVVPVSKEAIAEVKTKKDDIGPKKKRKSNNNGNQRIKFKTTPSTFELTTEASIGPMFPIKKLEARSEEHDAYLEARNSTETVLRGFKAEVNTIGGFKKLGYFKVGVNYAGFTETFTFSDVKTNQYWDPNGISSVEISPSGDTTYIYDSVLVTQDIQRKVNATNTYQMLDLTTAMGVKYAQSKWSIFADAGLAYNLMFKNKGRYLNESLEPSAFNQPIADGGKLFRKNLGLAVTANVGFAYEIKPNFSFKIQTGYKRYFNNFSTNENPIVQKYNFIDLGMGFQYTFNNF